MKILMFAVLCITAGCRISPVQDILRGEHVKKGVIEEISDIEDGGILDCQMDGRNPGAYGMVTIMSSSRYTYGEEGWIAVFIKHSRTLNIANASARVWIDVSDNIKLIKAVDSEFLPYVPENPEAVGFAPRYKQNYHVPLNENYFVRIRFRYLGTDEHHRAEIRFKYMQRIPAFAFGDFHGVYIEHHEIVDRFWKDVRHVFPLDTQTYCHPTQWNTLPSQTSIYTFEHGGRFHNYPDDYAKHLGFESHEAYLEWLESLD